MIKEPIMKTLEEAVLILNALENPEETISKYPNVPNTTKPRCMACPVAQFLEELVGEEVWVSPSGYAKLIGHHKKYYFAYKIIQLIETLDHIACPLY